MENIVNDNSLKFTNIQIYDFKPTKVLPAKSEKGLNTAFDPIYVTSIAEFFSVGSNEKHNVYLDLKSQNETTLTEHFKHALSDILVSEKISTESFEIKFKSNNNIPITELSAISDVASNIIDIKKDKIEFLNENNAVVATIDPENSILYFSTFKGISSNILQTSINTNTNTKNILLSKITNSSFDSKTYSAESYLCLNGEKLNIIEGNICFGNTLILNKNYYSGTSVSTNRINLITSLSTYTESLIFSENGNDLGILKYNQNLNIQNNSKITITNFNGVGSISNLLKCQAHQSSTEYSLLGLNSNEAKINISIKMKTEGNETKIYASSFNGNASNALVSSEVRTTFSEYAFQYLTFIKNKLCYTNSSLRFTSGSNKDLYAEKFKGVADYMTKFSEPKKFYLTSAIQASNSSDFASGITLDTETLYVPQIINYFGNTNIFLTRTPKILAILQISGYSTTMAVVHCNSSDHITSGNNRTCSSIWTLAPLIYARLAAKSFEGPGGMYGWVLEMSNDKSNWYEISKDQVYIFMEFSIL